MNHVNELTATSRLEIVTSDTVVTESPVITRVVTVTPKLAAEWLDRNTNNRHIKETNLESITEHMLNDTFQSLNGDTIKFSKTGKLLDGQHRLQAVVDTGKTYDFIIVEGVDDAAFTTLDIGVKRRINDMFQIDKVEHANAMSAISVFYIKLTTLTQRFHEGASFLGITNEQILSTYRQHEAILPSLLEQAKYLVKKMRIYPATNLAALMLYTQTHSQHRDRAMDEFWNPLFDDVYAEKRSPQINLLRSTYINNLNKRVPVLDKVWWTITAYNDHFAGRPRQRLVSYKGKKLPELS
jgi:hypothetical protein